MFQSDQMLGYWPFIPIKNSEFYIWIIILAKANIVIKWKFHDAVCFSAPHARCSPSQQPWNVDVKTSDRNPQSMQDLDWELECQCGELGIDIWNTDCRDCLSGLDSWIGNVTPKSANPYGFCIPLRLNSMSKPFHDWIGHGMNCFGLKYVISGL